MTDTAKKASKKAAAAEVVADLKIFLACLAWEAVEAVHANLRRFKLNQL